MATFTSFPTEFAASIPNAWFAAPAERSTLFFPVFSSISVAVQKRLRERILEFFLDDAGIGDQAIFYAILLYAASRPFRPRSRTELTYDVLDPALMKSFFHMASRNLGPALETLNIALERAGRPDLVRSIHPDLRHDALQAAKASKKTRELLNDLLAGEARLILDLTLLAGVGLLPSKSRTLRIARFHKFWEARLRRLCRGYDLRPLSSELFEAATAALVNALSPAERQEQAA